jgi:undecaprenyl diphosphate synthase
MGVLETAPLSGRDDRPGAPLHVAIIMDGNGRWATARGLPRTEGHRRGADAVRRTVEAACRLRLGTLTLYAFSSDNWKRPADEVSTLMRLFRHYLRAETAGCVKNDIRLSIVGRRDRLPRAVRVAIAAAERATASCRRLTLRLAVDYSARTTILRAAALAKPAELDDPASFRACLARAQHDPAPVPDVDLLVRTGGEKRLSDFLLWECAYAELVFTDRMWPDFGEEDLERALADFHQRERRFGRVLSV